MPVELPTDPADVAALWTELLDLADDAPVPWILIGAQMVALHAWHADHQPPRPSRDGDVLVNVRRRPTGTRQLAEHLERQGFELEGPNRMGLGHQFVREGVSIDILAPDNLGQRARLETLRNGRTVSVPGGTQALARAETIQVRLGTRTGAIPVPSLLGAIVLKFEAIAVDDVPDAQRADAALLLSLVHERETLAAQLSQAERRTLMRYPEFAYSDSLLYREIPSAREAAITYRRLTDESRST